MTSIMCTMSAKVAQQRHACAATAALPRDLPAQFSSNDTNVLHSHQLVITHSLACHFSRASSATHRINALRSTWLHLVMP